MKQVNMKLKLLQVNDVTQKYVSWFSNHEVIKYSDNQYLNFTLQGQKEYVKKCIIDKQISLYGVFFKNEHIGNVILKGIFSKHKRAEIGYVIGEKKYWGKGLGQLAIKLIVAKAKDEYKLNKLFASTAIGNIASIKVLEKNNFTLEGRKIKHLFYNNKFYDQLDYGLLL